MMKKKDGEVNSAREFGLSGGDRTPDPQLRRLMLYPTELRTENRLVGCCFNDKDH